LDSKLEQIESGYDVIRECGGIPQSCYIERCDGGPLVLLARILHKKSAVMISRFGLTDRGEEQPYPEITDLSKRYEAIAATLVKDGVLECTVDDVIVYGYLQGDQPVYDSFVMLWMDRSGKCSVARVMADHWPTVNMEQFKAFHLNYLRETYQGGWVHNDETPEAIITEIPGEFNSIRYP
jgi:hypothetical protein